MDLRLIAIAIAATTIFGGGWYLGNSRYVNYKNEVENIAKVQEAKNESIVKQQDLVNKATKENYEAKLSALKSYYGGLRQPSSGKLPSFSNPSTGINESASDQLLACAYTTQQLVSLQDWVNQVSGIK
jgi:hypothetical protein